MKPSLPSPQEPYRRDHARWLATVDARTTLRWLTDELPKLAAEVAEHRAAGRIKEANYAETQLRRRYQRLENLHRDREHQAIKHATDPYKMPQRCKHSLPDLVAALVAWARGLREASTPTEDEATAPPPGARKDPRP